MTERLKRIQGMAERYNKLGVVKNETVGAIDAAVAARTIPPVRTWLGIYGHSRFCNTDFDDMVGLHESIRRLHRLLARAPMSSAPVEPYKFGRHSLCHS